MSSSKQFNFFDATPSVVGMKDAAAKVGSQEVQVSRDDEESRRRTEPMLILVRDYRASSSFQLAAQSDHFGACLQYSLFVKRAMNEGYFRHCGIHDSDKEMIYMYE